MNFTVVVGLNSRRLPSFRRNWPTWVEHKPDVLDMPLLVFYDATGMTKDDVSFVEHPRKTVLPMNDRDGLNPRDKLEATFLLEVPFRVETDWYLRIDANVRATKKKKWHFPSWFRRTSDGRLPAFVAVPSAWTWPPDAIRKCDGWGDHVPDLVLKPRLGLDPPADGTGLVHPRVGGFAFFGRTEWCRYAAKLTHDRPPVWQHDTFLWFCAVRLGEFYRDIHFGHYGWRLDDWIKE